MEQNKTSNRLPLLARSNMGDNFTLVRLEVFHVSESEEGFHVSESEEGVHVSGGSR